MRFARSQKPSQGDAVWSWGLTAATLPQGQARGGGSLILKIHIIVTPAQAGAHLSAKLLSVFRWLDASSTQRPAAFAGMTV